MGNCEAHDLQIHVGQLPHGADTQQEGRPGEPGLHAGVPGAGLPALADPRPNIAQE